MTIFSGVLFFSLIVVTALSSFKIFLKVDEKILIEQKIFIQQTKKTLNKGSLSLAGACLTTMLSGFFIFFVYRMNIEWRETLYRNNSYLCSHYLNTQTTQYVKTINSFNVSLSASFIAMTLSGASASLKVIHEGLIVARDTFHARYLKVLLKNKYCGLPETLSYLKNNPYQLKLDQQLLTKIDGTTTLRATQWKYQLYLPPEKIRLKKSFRIETEMKLKDAFSLNITTNSKEI